MSTTVDAIRTFIFENFLFDADDDGLQNDDSFLDKGIIDSTGVLELVEWLEDEFGVPVEDEELLPENLDSVNQLAAFIARKKEYISSGEGK
ncbi:acyl carrier protein [bacterium BMS3Bbin14]|nr:acyl carrier protein [bacterium BMS3Abin13]GBE53316.1 acyl carrier protein [bacterium BMS3Bbin14]HDK44278.1 acyl carrier protein [Desulfobacteraceae bacterium]HDL98971.1 acyl carrier protein [Desulfobacteraceae bacterium]